MLAILVCLSVFSITLSVPIVKNFVNDEIFHMIFRLAEWFVVIFSYEKATREAGGVPASFGHMVLS